MQIFSEARLYNWLPCVDAYFVCEEEFKLVMLTKMGIKKKTQKFCQAQEYKQIIQLATEVIQKCLMLFSVVTSACWVK